MRRIRILIAGMLLCVCAHAPSQPAPAPAPGTLQPGEFIWHPEIAPSGPVVLVVSLDEQRAYVYRNGIIIGVSTISSGSAGRDTPTGVFTILQKNRDHYSNLYDNAPMPFMQRLTWGGIALHGGTLPGYPASHGCVRLPHAFAEQLFAVTQRGDTVVVSNAQASPASLVHPAVLAPVDRSGQPLPSMDIPDDGYFWDDSLSPEGPVSVLVSLADRRVFVLRNGVGIGEARLDLTDPAFAIEGSVLMVMGDRLHTNAPEAGLAAYAWTAYPMLGEDAQSLAMLQLRLQQDQPLRVAEAFSQRLEAALVPGATILLTDLPAVRASPAAQSWQPVLESDQEPDLESVPPSPSL